MKIILTSIKFIILGALIIPFKTVVSQEINKISESTENYITIPYKEQTIWTIGATKGFMDNIAFDGEFIAPPKDSGNWDLWYKKMIELRATTRKNLYDDAAMLIELTSEDIRFNGKQKEYSELWIAPGICEAMSMLSNDTILVEGESRCSQGPNKLYFGVDYKIQNFERIWSVGSQNKIDSISLPGSEEWMKFNSKLVLPQFNHDSLYPVIKLSLDISGAPLGTKLKLRNLKFKIPFTEKRLSLIQASLPNPIKFAGEEFDDYVYKREDLKWMDRDFIMGFVFIWDNDFYNHTTNEYTVDKFCEKGEKEFGGYNSVILWQNYPMLGIDSRNQFDMFDDMPGVWKE